MGGNQNNQRESPQGIRGLEDDCKNRTDFHSMQRQRAAQQMAPQLGRDKSSQVIDICFTLQTDCLSGRPKFACINPVDLMKIAFRIIFCVRQACCKCVDG